jgi:hypothetical protein
MLWFWIGWALFWVFLLTWGVIWPAFTSSDEEWAAWEAAWRSECLHQACEENARPTGLLNRSRPPGRAVRVGPAAEAGAWIAAFESDEALPGELAREGALGSDREHRVRLVPLEQLEQRNAQVVVAEPDHRRGIRA